MKLNLKQQPYRRITFHIRKDFEQKLQRLEDLKYYRNSLRLRHSLGKSNCRSSKQTCKKREAPYDLNGATVFCTLNLTTGNHQLELDSESRHVISFSSHVGARNAPSGIFLSKLNRHHCFLS